MVCELADEHYGLDIAKVFEIIRHQPITPVPRAPRFVEGRDQPARPDHPGRGPARPLRNGRGGADEGDAHRRRRELLHRVGLIVDSVSEVLLLPADSVEATPEVAAGADAEYLRGIAKLGDRLVLLLELDGLLRLDERTRSPELPRPCT